MLKYILQIVMCCLMLQPQAFAQGIDYSSKNYDYKADKRILVSYSYNAEADDVHELALADAFDKRYTKEVLEDKKLKKKAYTFVLEKDIRKELMDAEGKPLNEEAFVKYLHENFDANLKIDVKQLEYIQVNFPGYTYEIPHTVYHSYVGSDGKTYTYTTTWYETVYVPPHTEIRPYCDVRFDLVDLATDKIVWGREVGRDHGVTGPFASRNQGFHDTFDYLLKKFIKDYKSKLLK